MSQIQSQGEWTPDYSISPGEILGEELEARDMSQAELARRCGKSAKLISDIINARNPVEPDTALAFEKVLGVDAKIWLNLESDWQLFQARKREEDIAKAGRDWVKAFPQTSMKRLNIISGKDLPKIRNQILSFFGVANEDAYGKYWSSRALAFRHSPTFDSNDCALSVWLRLGEREVEEEEVKDFSLTKLKESLYELRALTLSHQEIFVPEIKKILNNCGIHFVVVPCVENTSACGVTYKSSEGKHIVQVSFRHKTNDHFWFTFFHEIGHIIRHGNKLFLEGVSIKTHKPDHEIYEKEANDFAEDLIFSGKKIREIFGSSRITKEKIISFSNEIQIHPAITVGALQHYGMVRWNHYRDLKEKIIAN